MSCTGDGILRLNTSRLAQDQNERKLVCGCVKPQLCLPDLANELHSFCLGRGEGVWWKLSVSRFIGNHTIWALVMYRWGFPCKSNGHATVQEVICKLLRFFCRARL